MVVLICLLIAVSLSLGVSTLKFYRLAKRPVPPPSQDLQDFMRDLMNGGGVVQIKVINPTDIYLRSPRMRK